VNLRTATRGDAALAFAALLLLISSFLPFYTVNGVLCVQGVTCSSSAWTAAFFPLLPSVFFAGIIGSVLVVLSRLVSPEPKVLGITIGHWGTVLTVSALWAALWAMFGGGAGVSHGAGAYLGLLGILLAVGAEVATPMVPALSAPLLSNPEGERLSGYPHGQTGQYHYGSQPVQQAQPGQPFTGPQQAAPGGYGYPQQAPQGPAPAATPTPAPAPAPAPQDTPPNRDQATALLKPVSPEPRRDPATAVLKPVPADPQPEAEPQPEAAAAPAAPAAPAAQEAAPAPREAAPAFAPFWFAVPALRTLAPEEDAAGAPVGELVPGTWYLAIAQRGDALLTQTQEGKRGLLTDTSGIQRG